MVRALDAVLLIARERESGSVADSTGGFGGLPATAGGLVFETSGSCLFALDAATGKSFGLCHYRSRSHQRDSR